MMIEPRTCDECGLLSMSTMDTCDECGLPGQITPDGLCRQCHEQAESEEFHEACQDHDACGNMLCRDCGAVLDEADFELCDDCEDAAIAAYAATDEGKRLIADVKSKLTGGSDEVQHR